MTAPLSPAAQAAWDAFNDVADRVGVFEDYGNALAAAIRAVADQLVPHEPDPPSSDGEPWPHGYQLISDGRWEQRQVTRGEILAIAAELEGRDG